MSSTQELVDLCEDIGIEPEHLSEFVYEVKSEEAAILNNMGLTAQIEYLLDELGERELRTLISDIGEAIA